LASERSSKAEQVDDALFCGVSRSNSANCFEAEESALPLLATREFSARKMPPVVADYENPDDITDDTK